jgi:hypothetical protein
VPMHACREWQMAPSARKEPVGYGSSPRHN